MVDILLRLAYKCKTRIWSVSDKTIYEELEDDIVPNALVPKYQTR